MAEVSWLTAAELAGELGRIDGLAEAEEMFLEEWVVGLVGWADQLYTSSLQWAYESSSAPGGGGGVDQACIGRLLTALSLGHATTQVGSNAY